MLPAAALSAMLRQPVRARASAANRPRVLIIGAGFAGGTCARYLRRMQPAIDVTLVDPAESYESCPMSNRVLTGLRDFASINVSRRGLARAGVTCLRDRVVGIEADSRRARLAGGATLRYDRLVMAPGIRMLWGTPQGYDEAAAQRMPHAWIAGAQTRLLAAQLHGLRDGGVVAISVPAGPMRCPPGPFERASLIAAYLKQHRHRCKILIFDSNNHFPRQDAFEQSWQELYPGMIRWIPVVEDGAVIRVDPSRMLLYTAQQAHRADVINIIPPQAPALLAAQAGLAANHGWCPVEPLSFASQLLPDVHVIGDACIADPMPKAASAANAQGRQCAAAIVAMLAGRPPSASMLESVCYSLLAQDRALSIHAQFRLSGEGIRQLALPDDPGAVSAAQEARNADAWYRDIIADSFG